MVNGTDSEVRCLGGHSPKSQDSYPVSPRSFSSPSMSPSHGMNIHNLATGKGSSTHFSGKLMRRIYRICKVLSLVLSTGRSYKYWTCGWTVLAGAEAFLHQSRDLTVKLCYSQSLQKRYIWNEISRNYCFCEAGGSDMNLCCPWFSQGAWNPVSGLWCSWNSRKYQELGGQVKVKQANNCWQSRCSLHSRNCSESTCGGGKASVGDKDVQSCPMPVERSQHLPNRDWAC